MRALVTAGNTREAIDSVRDWGNRFTGNTGYLIARALAAAKIDVELLTSNAVHRAECAQNSFPIHATAFTSHADLKGELETLMDGQPFDAVYMTAAVADYRPSGAYVVRRREVDTQTGEEHWIVKSADAPKVKSTFDEIAVLGERTEKLIDLFRTRWNHRGLLVKFKLEVGIDRDELIRIGRASREASGADYLVANTLDMVSGEGAGAYLLGDLLVEFVAREQLAARLSALAFQNS